MKFIKVNENVKLSEIALGAGSLGSAEREQICFEIMDKYVEFGGTTFDSARLYSGGNCDIALGKWLASRKIRHSVTIVTKGSHPNTSSMFVSRLSREEIESDLDVSLKAIGIECSDLHILHRDDVSKPVEEIVDSLDALVKAGKTLAVGVSNWTASRIIKANNYAKAAGKTPVTCSQAHFSLALTTAPATGDMTLVPLSETETGWYKESGMPVLAFGPQARGWFVARDKNIEPKPSPKNWYDDLPENHRRLARLQKLSRGTGYNITALTTAYVRDCGMAAVPLCAYSSVEQLTESMGALKFTLTKEQIKYLETGE